jgi:hypothetical protein
MRTAYAHSVVKIEIRPDRHDAVRVQPGVERARHGTMRRRALPTRERPKAVVKVPGLLGRIDIHRSHIIEAARWVKPVKWMVRRS